LLAKHKEQLYMIKNNLKHRMRSGEILIGVQIPLDATLNQIEEIISKDDYSFVCTDSQHTAFNEETLVKFCQHTKKMDIPTQFRIKHTRQTYLVGNILDLGPLSIEVPQVEDIDTVKEAVNYFYYPQKGLRSWGGDGRYGIEEIAERLEYSDWWNHTGILCLQMETLKAVTSVKQLAIEGVDCLTWGPNDLMYDIESHPKHPLKTVDDCVKHALDQLEGTGTKISFRSYDWKLREKYIDMGVTILMESPKK